MNRNLSPAAIFGRNYYSSCIS